MTPPASQSAARARRAPRETEARRPPLRVVSRSERRQARPRRRIAAPLAIALVVGSLVSVVVAHTMVASGQVDLTNAQAQLATEQSANGQLELSVASRESPQNITREATARHLSQQKVVVQLPYVPLTVALAPPNVTPAPPVSSSSATTGTATGQ